MQKSPLEYIENLQEQPEPVRKFATALIVIFLMIIIIGIWITTFSLTPQQKTANASENSDQPSPFSLLWNFGKDSFSSLKNLIH